MKPLDDTERQLAETVARLIATAGPLDNPEKLATPHALQLLARAHLELIDQVRALHQVPPSTITHDQLRELFARHCQCRPLDLTRTLDEHAAIHDCDTGILHDIQHVLGIIQCDDDARREARERCAVILRAKRNAQGGWDV